MNSSTPRPDRDVFYIPLVVVSIITSGKRKRQLDELLRSLALLDGPGVDFRVKVVVVFNGCEPDRDLMRRHPSLALTYVCETQLGIPYARNKSVSSASELGADYLAFIDDDETASPNWLRVMLASISEFDADAVAGRVDYGFELPVPRWLELGGFYDSPRFLSGEVLPSARTGNLMIDFRLLVMEDAPRFDTELRFTGGSDIRFTELLVARGAKIIWSNEATTLEFVPAERATAKWAIQRAFRVGNVTARDRIRSNWFQGAALAVLGGPARILVGLPVALASWMTRSHSRLGRSIRLISRGAGIAVAPFYRYEEYRR